ncbi:50S ribosomal protein L32 [Frankliniella fusca]|uniref:50S ribosomal protein L32 n=1 Tax=Frankliniella fusca TaxID=407009 RepID=A0AAE1LTX5_9NEOP|nr:50S ribosomal protein L32 [Frankliniella fusca]
MSTSVYTDAMDVTTMRYWTILHHVSPSGQKDGHQIIGGSQEIALGPTVYDVIIFIKRLVFRSVIREHQ